MKLMSFLGILGILLSFNSQAQSFKSSLVATYNLGTAAKPIAQAVLKIRSTTKSITHDSLIALRSDGHAESLDKDSNPSVSGEFLGQVNSGTHEHIIITSVFKLKIKYESAFKLSEKELIVQVSENGLVEIID